MPAETDQTSEGLGVPGLTGVQGLSALPFDTRKARAPADPRTGPTPALHGSASSWVSSRTIMVAVVKRHGDVPVTGTESAPVRQPPRRGNGAIGALVERKASHAVVKFARRV